MSTAKYWDRLLAGDSKHGWLKIDFDRWRGEDESEEEQQEHEISVILLVIWMCVCVWCLPIITILYKLAWLLGIIGFQLSFCRKYQLNTEERKWKQSLRTMLRKLRTKVC